MKIHPEGNQQEATMSNAYLDSRTTEVGKASKVRHVIGRWGPAGNAYTATLELELRVGDLAGDLAERGFKTVEHEPCPPATLTFTHGLDVRRGWREEGWSAGGDQLDELRQVERWQPGWSFARCQQFYAEFGRWHLNTMRGACAHMTPVPVGATITVPTIGGALDLFTVARYAPSRHAWCHPDTGQEMEHRYAEVIECGECGHKKAYAEFRTIYDAVDHFGVNRGLVCSAGSGYKYGSAWLVEPMPQHLLDTLATEYDLPSPLAG